MDRGTRIIRPVQRGVRNFSRECEVRPVWGFLSPLPLSRLLAGDGAQTEAIAERGRQRESWLETPLSPLRGRGERAHAARFVQTRRAGKACDRVSDASVPAILREAAGTRCALCPPYGFFTVRSRSTRAKLF